MPWTEFPPSRREEGEGEDAEESPSEGEEWPRAGNEAPSEGDEVPVAGEDAPSEGDCADSWESGASSCCEDEGEKCDKL